MNRLGRDIWLDKLLMDKRLTREQTDALIEIYNYLDASKIFAIGPRALAAERPSKATD